MAYFGDEKQDPREFLALPFGTTEWSRNLEHAVITTDTMDSPALCYDSNTTESKFYKEHPEHTLWKGLPGLDQVTLAPPPQPDAVRFGEKPTPSDWQRTAKLSKIKTNLVPEHLGKDANLYIQPEVDREKGTVTLPFSTQAGGKLTFRMREKDSRVLALRAAWSDELKAFTRVSVNIRVGELSPSRHFFDWMCQNQDELSPDGERPVQKKIQAVGWSDAAKKDRITEGQRTAWKKLLAGYLGQVCPWGRYFKADTTELRDKIGKAWKSLCEDFQEEAQVPVAGGKRTREEAGGASGSASKRRAGGPRE